MRTYSLKDPREWLQALFLFGTSDPVVTTCSPQLKEIKTIKRTQLSFSFHLCPTQKVDLLNGTVVDSTLLPGAGRLPAYSLNPNTYLDLAADELGLWVIYADPEYGGNLVINKLDKGREYQCYKYTYNNPSLKEKTT